MASIFDIYTYAGMHPGRSLLVLGAVHGNEICGTRAIERILSELQSGALRVVRGSLSLVPVTNRMAYEAHRREGDRNLNRNLAPTATPSDNEDRIANELCPLLRRHEVLLDLHSFHSPGEPFVMLGPEDNAGHLEPFAHAQDEEGFAVRLGVSPALDGWLDTYATGATRRGGSVRYGMGTTEYMRSVGGWGVTLECGQHDDAQAPAVAYRAIRHALAHLGLIEEAAPEANLSMQMLRLEAVVDRLAPEDRFARPWTSFEQLAPEEVIGWRADGEEVRAPAQGSIVFPNMNAVPGAEWFYFARPHARLAQKT